MPIPMNMDTTEQRQLNWWQFRNDTKPDYKDTLEGTLIEIDIVQKRGWDARNNKSVPEFWPDGNPKRAYRWIILDAVTGLPTAFEFNDTKNDSFKRGLVQSIPGLTDMESLGGHYLKIHSPNGVYNLQHPRPFTIQDMGVSNVPYEGTRDLLTNRKQQTQQSRPQQQNGVMPGGYPEAQSTQYAQTQGGLPAQQGYGNQVPVQQVPMQAQQVPVQNQTMAQQTVQQRPVQQQPVPVQSVQQPIQSVQQPVQQVPQHQDMQQAPQQQHVVTMDQVAAAPVSSPYDEEIPF